MNDTNWTIAYRNRRANRFLRVDLALTWSQANELAGRVRNALPPGHEVYYTTNAEAERTGYVCEEDRGNLLVRTGRRVRVIEGGVLPDGIEPLPVDHPAVIAVLKGAV